MPKMLTAEGEHLPAFLIGRLYRNRSQSAGGPRSPGTRRRHGLRPIAARRPPSPSSSRRVRSRGRARPMAEGNRLSRAGSHRAGAPTTEPRPSGSRDPPWRPGGPLAHARGSAGVATLGVPYTGSGPRDFAHHRPVQGVLSPGAPHCPDHPSRPPGGIPPAPPSCLESRLRWAGKGDGTNGRPFRGYPCRPFLRLDDSRPQERL